MCLPRVSLYFLSGLYRNQNAYFLILMSVPPEKNSRTLDLKLKPDLKLKICKKLNYNPTLETKGFYSNSAVTLNQSSNFYEYQM